MTTIRRTVATLLLTIGGLGASTVVLAAPSGAAQPVPAGIPVVPFSATAPAFSATGGSPIATSAYAALTALRGGAASAYSARLADLASLVGDKTGIDSSAFVAVWTSTERTRMTAMLAALTQVGAGYRYNTAKPGVSFDCSGLASWAWAQAGVAIPHQSRAIISTISKDSLDTADPGDVMYSPGHVMISLGVSDAYVHAADPRLRVEVTTLHGRHRSIRVGDPLGG